MAQTIQITNSEKLPSKVPAQVIALDPRVGDARDSDQEHLRILKIKDFLSRHLEVDQIIEVFMTEIAAEVNWCGYQFGCADIDTRMKRGVIAGFNVKYRLNMQDRLLGELTLYKRDSFANYELCQLEDLMCSLLYPLKNAIMYQIALKSAYGDPLTGLNNRMAMEKNLPREIDLAKRHSQSMALLMMDLDGFKQINDNCGHDVGDQVLRDVAQVISHVVRNTDLVYRYGGDEFVSGLPQTDIHGAVDVCERIRSSVDELDTKGCGVDDRVQISIGITLVRHGDSFLSVFKRADKALYQAKINGKNQIIIC